MVGPPFAPFADTYLPGIYHVRSVPAQGVGASFAVNSFIPRKPDEPGPSILHLGQRTPTKPHSVSTLQDLAWALGIVVVVLLSAEWWVAFRG